MTTNTKLLSNLFFNEFDEFFGSEYDFIPSTDVVEDEKSYRIDLMLPAFNKKDFKIKIEKDSIIIEGERKKDDKIKYNIIQSRFGNFKRSFILPDFVDKDNVDAEYVDGVLSVTIPKSEEKLRKRLIKVN